MFMGMDERVWRVCGVSTGTPEMDDHEKACPKYKTVIGDKGRSDVARLQATMPRQQSAADISLSLVIPQLPLSRRRSSLLSSVSDPHTPPPRNSPLPLFPSASNRKSTDSWNSSNYDGADDLEWEWKPEQTRLLSRTLDALPAHLLTPFNGPVPPSNLLDKIARGVAQVKGPLDWPHSLRATRAKIVELARLRGKEGATDSSSDTIEEEETTDVDVLQQTTNTGPKRPLYRQSSMDFMQTTKLDLKDNGNISRSTTLNSVSSIETCSRHPAFTEPAADTRVHRIRRVDSYAGSVLYPPGNPLKRAPSFGAASKRSSDAMSIDLSNRNSDATSSDEEEKLRSVKAKKARVKVSSPTPTRILSPLSSPEKSRLPRKLAHQPPNKSSKAGVTAKPTTDSPARRSTRPRANLQRNPSILGEELPMPQPNLPLPATVRSTPRVKTRKSPKTYSPTDTTPGGAAQSPALAQQPRSLRRTKGPNPTKCTVARKISFGSLASPVGEENIGRGAGSGLGSAFQLH
ncbi:hypothetical protein A0H81_07638 [Grifola frondosa]|uniref:Uncharacterized protein n=1 Tax=Grifola frondosa TaxID=5627 RepID=A0A1C7MB08_GRIFR|nr:hypothetical protein A0H81_07638 [Grifola frondosa]